MNILIITSKYDIPVNEIIEIINRKGHEVFRLNTEDFCRGIELEVQMDTAEFTGKIVYGARSIQVEDVQSIFFRRPQRPYLDYIEDQTAKEFIEAEIAAFTNWLWQALTCFWVSQPLSLRRAESKIDQLRVAPRLGFHIPKTLITNRPEAVRKFYHQCNGRIINKVLGKGVVKKGDVTYGIYTHRVEEEHLEHLDSVKDVPCVFQERIEKAFELRITVVGREVFAAEIHSQLSPRTRDDWRRYDFDNTPHKIHRLPNAVTESCLRLLAHYGLNFGAIDMIVTPDEEYVFLELNPNGQWLWIERLTGLLISEAIADMLIRGYV